MVTDPVQEIEATIQLHRATRAEAQVRLELAVHRREKAQEEVAAALADEESARILIRARSADIDTLLEQLWPYIPKQRPPTT